MNNNNEEKIYVLREYEIHHDTNEEYLSILGKNLTKLQASQLLHEHYKEFYENPIVESADFTEDETLDVPNGKSKIVSATIIFTNGVELNYIVGTNYHEGEEEEYNALNSADFEDDED